MAKHAAPSAMAYREQGRRLVERQHSPFAFANRIDKGRLQIEPMRDWTSVIKPDDPNSTLPGGLGLNVGNKRTIKDHHIDGLRDH